MQPLHAAAYVGGDGCKRIGWVAAVPIASVHVLYELANVH